jgi:hypothetical protein
MAITKREKLVEVLDQYQAAGLQIVDLRKAAVEFKERGGEGIEAFLNEQLRIEPGDEG